MDRSKIGQFFKETFKKDDSDTVVKSGQIISFIFARYRAVIISIAIS